ncbi:MAG: M48 family metalloprotease [Rickettsiales bacterium]
MRLFVLLLILLLFPWSAWAENGLIRDAEIETYLHSLSRPIFEAAGVDPESVQIFIIDSNTINAFVAGGSNMFFNTGLLMETNNPEMLLGVMAHETGHIAGAHLARGARPMQNAQIGAIISYVVGAAAAAAGAGDVGMAIMSGGSEVANRGILSYTRSNERAADQMGLEFLDADEVTAEGMLDMFEKLRRNEKRYLGRPDPYTQSHPLSFERIAVIRRHLANSQYKNNRLPEDIQVEHKRMLAKLDGFLNSPERVMNEYPTSDQSLYGRYARAVAYYRSSDLDAALKEINSLLKEYPDDPYFYELKGQVLYENGKIQEARTAYAKAKDLAPNAAIIRADYARTLLGLNDPSLVKEAVTELERATGKDGSYGTAWRALSDAYGRAGNQPMATLALAEEASLRNDLDATIRFATQAKKALKEGSPGYLRAADLIEISKRTKKEQS